MRGALLLDTRLWQSPSPALRVSLSPLDAGRGTLDAQRAVSFAFMDEPEYLICLECETPTYQFEFEPNGKLISAMCNTCGNDNVSEFMTEAELEEQSR
jgi:hypothetical protein